jgi:hypothetical protein
MRFEIYVLIAQLLVVLPLASQIYGWRFALSSIAISIYGPAASLVKLSLGPAIFPFGSFIALIGIIILILASPINKRLFIYLLFIFFMALISSFLGSGVSGIIKAAHFLLYAIFGILLGNYISRFTSNEKTIFTNSLFFSASFSFLILIFLRFEGVYISNTLVDMRDVGFGMLPIFLIFLLLQKEPSIRNMLKLIAPFIYLLLSLTRSYLLDLVLVVIYTRKRLFGGRRSFFKPIFYGLLIIGVSIIFLSRASSSSNPVADNNQEQYEEIAEVLALTTRLNGLLEEWEDFSNKPLFGNGIAYYEEEFESFKERGLATITDAEYIAYNHVGVISVLAQGGIILFILTIFIPFYTFFKNRKILFSSNDKILFSCFCLFLAYFILFFVSGSPIRKDYTDAVLYYLIIGYTFNSLFSARKNLNK